MRQLGHHARREGDAFVVEQVRQPVVDHCPDARVADQHLVLAAGGRVALVGGGDIRVDQLAHPRQGLAEALDDGHGPFTLVGAQILTAGAEHQLAPHLLVQGRQRHVQRVAHIVVDILGTEIGAAQAMREQRRRQPADHLGQYLPRRQQRRPFIALAGTQGTVAAFAQLRHHLVYTKGRFDHRHHRVEIQSPRIYRPSHHQVCACPRLLSCGRRISDMPVPPEGQRFPGISAACRVAKPTPLPAMSTGRPPVDAGRSAPPA